MRYEQIIMIGLLVVLYLGVFDPVINFLQGNILSLLDVLTGFNAHDGAVSGFDVGRTFRS